jgi:class 3 adenylate cyclase/tetratricopeptide (TPR) repeat protein
VVVLFADIKEYTKLSDDIGDPEVVHEIIEPIYHLMESSVKLHGGTVIGFEGDNVLAVFGAPEAHENDEVRAIRCALEMHRRMKEHPETHGRKLVLTIGINSGLVVAGMIGAAETVSFNTIGDTVNVAARLQDKAGAEQVFVSDSVFNRAKPYFIWGPVGPFDLKNKPYPIQAYNVIAERDLAEATRFVGAGMAAICGRDLEMETIEELLVATAKGNGQVAGVTGEAGVGKSRLIYELKNRAEYFGFQVLVGRTISYGQNMPLWPVKEIIRQYVGLKEREEIEIAQKRLTKVLSPIWEEKDVREDRISTLMWFLGYPMPDFTIEKLDDKDKKRLLEVTLNDFFISITKIDKVMPLVLVLEDMHWSSITTKDWIVQFSRLARNEPILVVLSYRPEFEYNWSSERFVTFNEIQLKPMEVNSIKEMVSSMLAVEKAPEELSEFIAQKSQGNPFFAEEIVRYLLEEGIIIREVNVEDRETGIKIIKQFDSVEIPTSVQMLIMSRVDNLETYARQVLLEASVIGQTFQKKLLMEISNTGGKLREGLDNLLESNMIHIQSWFPELEYTFHHILTHDTVYNTIALKNRIELHKAIIDTIFKLIPQKHKQPFSLLAHHYELFGDNSQAAYYLHLEGGSLRNSGDLNSSYDILKKAANLADHDSEFFPDIILDKAAIELEVRSANAAQDSLDLLPKALTLEQSIERFLILGEIMLRHGQTQKAIKEFNFARNLTTEIKDNKEQIEFRIQAKLGNANIRKRTTKSLNWAEECFRSCLVLADKTQDDNMKGTAFGGLGNVFSFREWPREAIEYYNKSKPFKEKSKNLASIARLHGNMGREYAQCGEYRLAIDHLSRSIDISKRIGQIRELGIAYNTLGNVFWQSGSLDNALGCFEESISASRKNNYLRGEAIACCGMGNVYRDKGELDNAEEMYNQYCQLSVEAKYMPGELIAMGNIGQIQIEKGDFETAKDILEKTIEEAFDKNQLNTVAENRTRLAGVYHGIGRHNDSMNVLDHAIGYFKLKKYRKSLFYTYLIQATQMTERKETTEAAAIFDKAESFLQEIDDDKALREYHFTKGRLYAAFMQQQKADESYKQALRHAKKCTNTINHDLYREYGKFLASWYDATEGKAREYLEKAKEIYEYRVSHGARRKELDEVNELLEKLLD